MKTLKLLSLLFILAACGSEQRGTTVAENASVSSPTKKITISQLVDGQVSVSMPLEIFGTSEDDLTGASFDILQNGRTKHSNINPQSFYSSSLNAVRFSLSSLQDGDELDFVVHLANGNEDTYEGEVSDTQTTEATNPQDVANVSGETNALTGTYKASDRNTCFPDGSDRDNLFLEIVGNQVTTFELDDDNTEVVQSYSNNRIDFDLLDDETGSGQVADCHVNFSNNIASGSCSVGGFVCTLYYEKCSNDPNGGDLACF